MRLALVQAAAWPISISQGMAIAEAAAAVWALLQASLLTCRLHLSCMGMKYAAVMCCQ